VKILKEVREDYDILIAPGRLKNKETWEKNGQRLRSKK
jgi:hypothetical protein